MTPTKPDTLEDLARQVLAVREAQKQYFRTRDRGDLQESKRLESQLDRTLSKILAGPEPPAPEPDQLSLF